ncbi:hypothetical protein P7C70_g5175, partial [Phenoliferia sp. Uapishka_3]
MDAPPWISRDPESKPAVGVEKAGQIRRDACVTLAHRAIRSMTSAGVFERPSSLNLEILAYADLLNHLILRDSAQSQFIRLASIHHLRAAPAFAFEGDLGEYDFLTGKAFDVVATLDSERAAQDRTLCLLPKDDVFMAWLSRCSQPLDLSFSFLANGSKLPEEEMDNMFSHILASCYSKIGATQRLFADKLGNQHAFNHPKMDKTSARVIIKQIENVMACLQRLNGSLSNYFFPQKVPDNEQIELPSQSLATLVEEAPTPPSYKEKETPGATYDEKLAMARTMVSNVLASNMEEEWEVLTSSLGGGCGCAENGDGSPSDNAYGFWGCGFC